MHKVSIVILNYNGEKYLEEFLPKVIINSPECKIVVADNCSTDDSVKLLHKNFPNVELIQIPFNGGYSAGYNYALDKIESEFYILLNSDIEVTPNWVGSIIKFMENNPEVAACQPKILSYNERDSFEYAGAAGGFIDYLGYPYCRGRIFSTVEKDLGQYNDRREIFWASGACLFIRSKVFHEQGGLDEDFFAHMEEIDLCWRFQLSNWKVYYFGESTVYHVGGGTLNASNPQKTYLNFRNGLSMLFKNTPSRFLPFRILFRLILDGIAAIKFIFDSGFQHSFAVLKAHCHFYLSILKNLEKRKSIDQGNLDTSNISSKSIVWQYYIKGRKIFNKLH